MGFHMAFLTLLLFLGIEIFVANMFFAPFKR